MKYPSILALVLLAACGDGNPFSSVNTGGDPDDGDVVTDADEIPEALSNDLSNVAYNPTSGSLFVDITALDEVTDDYPLERYQPNAALQALSPAIDAQGYRIYSFQDDALDRMFVAIVSQSPDGSATGAVVMDGGQFTKFFGGVNYSATDFTPGSSENDTGLVSYAGTYAGLSNLDADGAQLLTPATPVDPEILPAQPAMIESPIFLNADFGDNTVNGAIYERSFVNLAPAIETLLGGPDLPTVYLIPTDITDEGTFFGNAQNPAQEDIGTYGGAFGGDNATAVAGGIHLDGDFIPGIDNEEEFGVFVLVQCGQPGDDAICANIPVNP